MYLDNEDTRSLHSELEKMADPYVYATLGNQDKDLYKNKKLANIYSITDSILFNFMNDVSEQVYNASPSVSEEKRWCNVLLADINTGIGYTYTDFNESENYLDKNGRKETY